MQIRIEPAVYADLESMREQYRQEANCQIVHYSFIGRGLADPYLIRVGENIAGYGAISNKYDKGRVVEFHLLPEFRADAESLFGELLTASQATELEAQTNMPLMLAMLREFGTNAFVERTLFLEGRTTNLACPNGFFRERREEDGPGLFGRPEETLSDWVVESNGEIVAAGGFLTHYNPPHADIFMEVAESARRKGFGSYLVQEVKRVCYEAGKKPAARCDPGNIASRKTLEKAGLAVCAEMLVAKIRSL
ncbi:MAG TPA: GNAT family N-acetyltransferase [Candidatus Acidoferrales bacterium]|nr:GNAT family N-acetyltransferase [Candidatus Acidoferrales bacterium]